MAITNSGTYVNSGGTAGRLRGTTGGSVGTGSNINYDTTDFNQANVGSSQMSVAANDSGFWFMATVNGCFMSGANSLRSVVYFFDRGLSTNVSYSAPSTAGTTAIEFCGLIYLSTTQTATSGTSFFPQFAWNTGSTYTIFAGRWMSGCKIF
jgi:hypothetical protein